MNDDENERYRLFIGVDYFAACGGKLNVLKWFVVKGLFIDINKSLCANEGAKHGHLHVMKWLQEEQGLILNGGYYNKAIDGGHLNIVKWLDGKGQCFDTSWRAAQAAYGGHVNILQWLLEEKGLHLFGRLYDCAIDGGQLCVK